MRDRRSFLQTAPFAAAALLTSPSLLLPTGAVHAQQGPRPLAPALADPLLHRRAIEAMVWGMPAVNLELMLQAMLTATPGRPNQMLYWSRLLDWKCQTLTPNSDVIYLKAFWDMREAGPIVVEIPPADDGVINGTLMDSWQSPFEDVGPAGADGGKGGRYLLLPPVHDGPVPDGYRVFQSSTYTGYALFRSILRGGSPDDLRKAVDYGKRIRLYPLSQVANPPPTVYTDADGTLFDAVIPYDSRYYEHLDRFIQKEPWMERDRAMIDTLRAIGMEKGKPFAPDAARRKQLDAAAADARALLDAQFELLFDTPFAPGGNWAFVTSEEYAKHATAGFPDVNVYPIDDRGLLFTFVFFTPRRLGEGQFWTMTHKDASGAPLDGSGSYRLRVPPKVPVNQYWSITLYDRHTHAFIRNMPFTSRSSQTPGLRTNSDGSVDLFFGPAAPKDWEQNWAPTDPARPFEAMARFYGPEPALFDHSWVLPNIERID